MTRKTGKKTWLGRFGKLLGLILEPGWKRWLLFAMAAVLLVILAALSRDRLDPAADPSALVPRSVQFYLETRDAREFFARAGGFPLWGGKDSGEGAPNRLSADFAAWAGEAFPGLPLRLPLLWLIGSTQAAFAVLGEGTSDQAWILLLQTGESRDYLAELGIESGWRLEKLDQTPSGGLFLLAGRDGGSLYLAEAGNWFAVSSAETASRFALDSLADPAFSLANSDLLADWRRDAAMRGLLAPAHFAADPWFPRLLPRNGWNPGARLAFTAGLDPASGLEVSILIREFDPAQPGGGVWPLIRLVFILLAAFCLFLALAVILAALGFGAWLKFLAMKAGLTPAEAPAAVKPSDSFREDAGMPENALPAPERPDNPR
ncbi:MAG: hypothetical protein LBU64_05405 [Planctomycetota bacterium]|jgi:hypothetical protein|nr:hypothetical protein [Planctomycetota bacterium]